MYYELCVLPVCVTEPPPTYEESCSSANASFSSQQ